MTFCRNMALPGRLALLVSLFAGALLAGAVASELLWGLRPCELCMQQRWMLLGVMLAGGLGVALQACPRTIVTPWMRYLCSTAIAAMFLFLVGNIMVALQHGAVERGWIPPSCGVVTVPGQSVEDMLRSLPAVAPPRCDEIQFQFLALSMADWNALLSLLVAVMGGGRLMQWLRRRPSFG